MFLCPRDDVCFPLMQTGWQICVRRVLCICLYPLMLGNATAAVEPTGEQHTPKDQLSLFNTSSVCPAQSPWGLIAYDLVSQLLSWKPTAWHSFKFL